MTWFDVLVFTVLVISTGLASVRGISREMSTLLCLCAAAGMTFGAAGPLAALTARGGGGALLLGILVIGLFIVLFVVWATIIDGLLGRYFGKSPNTPDRILGGVFGFARGYFLAGFIFLTLSYYTVSDTGPRLLERGLITPLARSAGGTLEAFGMSTSRPSKDGTTPGENDSPRILSPGRKNGETAPSGGVDAAPDAGAPSPDTAASTTADPAAPEQTVQEPQ